MQGCCNRLSTRLVGKRELDCHSILFPHHPRDVAFASQVLSELHVPRSQSNLLASCIVDLSSAAERDHVLATRRSMPVIDPAGRRPMDLGARHLQHLGDFGGPGSGELDFDLICVRQAVRSGVEPSDDDRLACLSHDDIMVSACPRYENNRAHQTDSDWPPCVRSHRIPPFPDSLTTLLAARQDVAGSRLAIDRPPLYLEAPTITEQRARSLVMYVDDNAEALRLLVIPTSTFANDRARIGRIEFQSGGTADAHSDY